MNRMLCLRDATAALKRAADVIRNPESTWMEEDERARVASSLDDIRKELESEMGD